MTGNRTGVPLITDILDVLDRHGYTRSDNAHTARAILLISDLAHIYEGSQDHPFGPYIGEIPPRTEPPAARAGQPRTPSASRPVRSRPSWSPWTSPPITSATAPSSAPIAPARPVRPANRASRTPRHMTT